MRLWDVTDPAHPGPLGHPLHRPHRRRVAGGVRPDGHTLATASDDSTVLLWDVTDPAHPGRLGQPLTGHTAP